MRHPVIHTLTNWPSLRIGRDLSHHLVHRSHPEQNSLLLHDSWIASRGRELTTGLCSHIELKSAFSNGHLHGLCLPACVLRRREPGEPRCPPTCWSTGVFDERVVRMNNEAVFSVCHSATSEPSTLGETTPAVPTIPYMTGVLEYFWSFLARCGIQVAVFVLSSGPLKRTQFSSRARPSFAGECALCALCIIRAAWTRKALFLASCWACISLSPRLLLDVAQLELELSQF